MKMLNTVSALILATVCSIANAGGMLSSDIMWGGDIIADNWGENRTSLLETGQAVSEMEADVESISQASADNQTAISDVDSSSVSRDNQLAGDIYTTNKAVANNGKRIDFLEQANAQLRSDMYAGVAGAMSHASLPDAPHGQSGLVMGVGHYAGQGSAIAIGYAYTDRNSNWSFKTGASYDTAHKVGLSAGVGYFY